MPRLFFALNLPPAVSDSLDDLCEGIPRARWALENEYHITLSFLGEVEPRRVVDAIDAAEEVFVQPFELELEGAGVFPHRGPPRVLWAGVKKTERLMSLQRALEAALVRSEFAMERRKYHPHVTLARVDQSQREHLAEWLGKNLSYRSAPFKIFRFHMFSSVLTGHGSHHTLERSFELRS